MAEFKFFDPGYPKSLPINTSIYALYHPVFDCFLMISDVYEVAQTLRWVLSSRYTTHLVSIASAHNFVYGEIDNSQCEQWTIVQKSCVDATNGLLNSKIVTTERLCKSTPIHNWDINKEKQWSFLCMFWIKRFHAARQYLTFSSIDSHLNSFLNLPLDYKYNSDIYYERDVMKLLYLETDFEITIEKIAALRRTTTTQ